MEQKLVFREMLSEIKKLAAEQENKLTLAEIKVFFEKANLDEEQFNMVLDYLHTQRVQIDGWEKRTKEAVEGAEVMDKEEKSTSSLKDEALIFYEKELAKLEMVSPKVEKELFERAAKGDTFAKHQVIERCLKTVRQIAEEYAQKEIILSDLIQEGNIGLILCMEQLPLSGEIKEYQDFIKKHVQMAMKNYLEEVDLLQFAGKQIEEKVNYLSAAIKNLEEDLEKKVTLEEVSTYLEMPVEEIKDILKMAGDEIEIEGYEKK
jgi:DNA-directed RNA polymerase, sigma subunit (sigma70/sigma32)